jgi:transcriptional regulator with XRE-family HTH domain
MTTIMQENAAAGTGSYGVLRGARDGLRMTLRELASRIGCSHQHLARIESGERAITPEFAARWSRAIADRMTELTTVTA